jgi:cerevisin
MLALLILLINGVLARHLYAVEKLLLAEYSEPYAEDIRNKCSCFVTFYVCNTEEFPIYENIHFTEYSFDDDVTIADDSDSQQLSTCRKNSLWHLGRMQSRAHIYNNDFGYDVGFYEFETTVYVADTFVDVDHPEFEGRAKQGYNGVNGKSNDHGTHVAGLIGGKSVGADPYANIISVVVLADNGYGKYSDIIKGLEYIQNDSLAKKNVIINMSLAGNVNSVFERVINSLISRGLIIVAAAGNNGALACDYYPAGIAGVITVGSINKDTAMSTFSNYGKCVDILAPGEVIYSSLPNINYGYMSGTSMAAPLVAGLISYYGSHGLSPIAALLIGTKDIVKNIRPDTNNLLAYMIGSEYCSQKSSVKPESLFQWIVGY